MAAYEPPVSRLLELGRPELLLRSEWDYSRYAIGPEHIPDLIRLLRDSDLMRQEEDLQEKPHHYAYIHAWRALGQLGAEAAIDPLLDIIRENDETDDLDDWVMAEVPVVLGMIGPPALAATAERLEQTHARQGAPETYAQALEEIAKAHPETRSQVVAHLVAFLDHARENDPTQNAFIIVNLMDLKAVEAWPAIESAFVSESVDPSIAGDVDDIKFELGLGPKPPSRARWVPPGLSKPGQANAKQRAEHHAKKRKAEKRKQKKKRR